MQFLCECMKTDCEIDCGGEGVPAKVLPRASNFSGSALIDPMAL